MITTQRRRRNQTVRMALLPIITGITTLILFFGSMALHISGFAPFSFAHAATTCETTKGTQPSLCEQQNPTVQGCTHDAHSIEMESVYTDHNQLLGEVDLRHSATCKTFWIRTIAYANAPQVQAVDAIITFSTGKIEDVKTTASSRPQRLIAITNMLFVLPTTFLIANWKGEFHMSGQKQPLSIPLQSQDFGHP